MRRRLSIAELLGKLRELGYVWIELSLRGDFQEWFGFPVGQLERPPILG
jgi:myo-inositol catabolism protein IolH